MAGKIAYVMSRFPHLPETFILREMEALERQGWEVALFPLILQEQTVIHAAARPWLPRARRIPLASPRLVWENLRFFGEAPLTSLRVGARGLWENLPSPKFLSRALVLLPKAFYAARLLQQEGITHIHAHYATHPAFFAWVIHRLTGISYSITVHAHDIYVDTTMLAVKLREAAFVVAISEFNVRYLERVLGPWVTAKTHIIHCGIEPERFKPATGDRGGGRSGRFEILSIGSLQPYKGQVHLIRACALLKGSGVPFRCRIIGGGGGERALQRAIREEKLEEEVFLLGPLPEEEVARLLPEADCYVQPSIVAPSGKMEGIPVSLMEALACGLPVVATDLSGVPELVRPGQTGLLVPPGDAHAIASALLYLYNSPDEARRLAIAGRALVLADFDLHNNVQQLAELFASHLTPAQ